LDLAGGTPLTICDVPAIGRGGAWSSGGQILFGKTNGALFRVPASGGAPSPLTTLDASRSEVAHRWPQVLPGGRFLYWAKSDHPENNGVYAASFDKPGQRVRLLTTDANALYASGSDGKGYLLWLRGETLFAQEFDPGTFKLAGEPHRVTDPVAGFSDGKMGVAVSATGRLLYTDFQPSSQLTWLDRSGKSLGVVGEPSEYSTFSLSRDGRRAAVAREYTGGNDLWLLELERGVSSRLTSNLGGSYWPIWSPDGRTIVYSYSLARIRAAPVA
jgi:serine/threonine-protein kinase